MILLSSPADEDCLPEIILKPLYDDPTEPQLVAESLLAEASEPSAESMVEIREVENSMPVIIL